jgi:putative oxidoreductase
MKIVSMISRILLGLIFIWIGVSAFFRTAPPPLPGLAGTFMDVFFRSHWALFVAAVQLILGALLFVNRFVPAALIMLAAFLYNSFAFHITMLQSALFAPIIVFVLWLLVALRYRTIFAPVFAAQARTD